jgi:multidrug efflux pump subunit AcrA (membrane-fusion protein)
MILPNEQSPPSTTATPSAEAPRPRRGIVLVALAIILAAGMYSIWRVFFAKPAMPENIVALSGRIEGDDSAIAPKTTGRILEIRFREGDTVKAGDVIAILSDEQIRAQRSTSQCEREPIRNCRTIEFTGKRIAL